jgi:hypothetical protein
MELQTLEDAVRFRGREGFIQCAGRALTGCPERRGSARHRENGCRPDRAYGRQNRRRCADPSLSHAAMAGARRDTQTDWRCHCGGIRSRSLSAGPAPAGFGSRTSPISWIGLSSKQTTGRCGSGGSAYRSSTPHPRDVGAVHLRNAPHVAAPGLQVVLGLAGPVPRGRQGGDAWR